MVVSKNKLLIELINNQRENVDQQKKLDIKDLHRICKNINGSIFSKSDECCLWCGYITTINTSNTKYINFFFKKKKYALHRLLYENFIDEIDKSEYLRFTCENKGTCCNLNHIKKITKRNSKNSKKEQASDKKDNNVEKDIELKKKSNKKKFNNKSSSIEVITPKEKENKLIIIF